MTHPAPKIKIQNTNQLIGNYEEDENFISVVTKKIPTEINRNLNLNLKHENFGKNYKEQISSINKEGYSSKTNSIIDNERNNNINIQPNFNDNSFVSNRNNSNRSFSEFEINNKGYSDKKKFKPRDKTFDNSISVKTKSNFNKELSKGYQVL